MKATQSCSILCDPMEYLVGGGGNGYLPSWGPADPRATLPSLESGARLQSGPRCS